MIGRRKKLIEIALPLKKINEESAREKSIRHGHPSTLHLWWARRPLAACRAVLFAQLVDDPSSDPTYLSPDGSVDEERAGIKRAELFNLIEELVQWENSNNSSVIDRARAEIARSVASRKIELDELQKDIVIFGPEEGKAHPDGPLPNDGRYTAWQVNCRLAPPKAVNHFLAEYGPPVLDPFAGGGSIPLEAQRLGLRAHASDLNPVAVLINKALIEIPPKFAGMSPVNPEFAEASISFPEETCYGAAGLAEDVRYYGKWMRDEAEKRIGHLYPKIKITQEMVDGSGCVGTPPAKKSGQDARAPGSAGVPPAKENEQDTHSPRPDLKPYVGQELTVIAWLWARTVPSPDPSVGGKHVPLVRSFWLSKKKGKEAYVQPIINRAEGTYEFKVKLGKPKDGFDPNHGTVIHTCARCLISDSTIPFDHVREAGKNGEMEARLMAIVCEGGRGRVYLSPDDIQETTAACGLPNEYPISNIPQQALGFRVQLYGMDEHWKLFTPRQLTALTTFSDLVSEARERVLQDAMRAQASRPQKPVHTRGYLPHWEAGSRSQSITFRLADSLPQTVLEKLEAEILNSTEEEHTWEVERRKRIERYLDAGHGSCALQRPEIAELVENALLYFDGMRYNLHAWTIMPNHVHVLITPLHENSISSILHSWKSFTAKKSNKLLGHNGKFWQEEYFDRMIRDKAHFDAAVRYIEENPVKAGLCKTPAAWERGHLARIKKGKEQDPQERAAQEGAAQEGAAQEGAAQERAGQERAGQERAGQERAGQERAGQERAGRPRSQEVGPHAYADAVATYLGFALDKSANYWSSLCGWHSGRDIIMSTFGRQALPMVWDFAEANPLSDSTGNYLSGIRSTSESLMRAPACSGSAVHQSDATNTASYSGEIISTDPPYYDNIGYADLSDFFYVWLRRSLKDVYPQLLSTMLTPKSEEMIASPYRHKGNRAKASEFFEKGLGTAIGQWREHGHSDYPTTIFYAFKQAETTTEGTASTGWETFLTGVIDHGFVITGTWPMRTELTGNLKKQVAALASSVVLACVPRAAGASMATRREFLNELKRELPDALRLLQGHTLGARASCPQEKEKAGGTPALPGIAPVDLAQAAIGPGMAVFSRYAKVVEADGSAMTVRTALTLINQMLDEVLAEQEGEFDADTRWTVAWFEQYGIQEGPYGVAETLSRAKNTSVQGLVEAGIVMSRAGSVKLLGRDDLPADWDPAADKRLTAWEATQHLIRALDQAGESGAAGLLRQLGGDYADKARDLAYRLFSICERKGWTGEALAYNSIVLAWPEISKLVQATPKEEQPELFEKR
ncbi:MAG: DUF1156 domain-containing protein [Verrucomicrobia bacterium]|nr:DUF1156 domain-containing protein [Verrucomicrobiota bacterium]